MEFTKDAQVRELTGLDKTVDIKTVKEANTSYQHIKEEAGNAVFEYFEDMGIFQNGNAIILSSKHYYSYNIDYMKDSNIIFNLKVSNRIDNIRQFFYNLNNFLPINGYYIGSFEDLDLVRNELNNKILKRFNYFNLMAFSFVQRIILNIPVMGEILFLINKGRRKYLTSQDLIKLLDENGFQVFILKTFDHRSYFLAKKVNRQQKMNNEMLNRLYLFLNRKYLIHN